MTKRLALLVALATLCGACAPAPQQKVAVEEKDPTRIVLSNIKKYSYIPVPESCDAVLSEIIETAFVAQDTKPLLKKAIAQKCLHPKSYIVGFESIKTSKEIHSVVPTVFLEKNTVEHWRSDSVLYVRIKMFSRSTFNDVEHVLKENQDANLVLDLRDNSGGGVKEFAEISSLFAPYDGASLMVLHTRTEQPAPVIVKKEGLFAKRSTIILVNRRTASSAELLAGILKYWGGAHVLIVGEQTYGKASVQSCLYCLDALMALITVAVVTIGDVDRQVVVEEVGVTPDIYLVSPIGPVARDTQLLFALRWFSVISK